MKFCGELDLYWVLSGGMIVAVLFTSFVIPSYDDDIEELGQSICEEEFDMDFNYYDNKELKCKPKIIKNETIYDGIVVSIT